jgi:hypothetical protein
MKFSRVTKSGKQTRHRRLGLTRRAPRERTVAPSPTTLHLVIRRPVSKTIVSRRRSSSRGSESLFRLPPRTWKGQRTPFKSNLIHGFAGQTTREQVLLTSSTNEIDGERTRKRKTFFLRIVPAITRELIYPRSQPTPKRKKAGLVEGRLPCFERADSHVEGAAVWRQSRCLF